MFEYLSLDEMVSVIDIAKHIYNDKFNNTYIRVEVYNRSGNIAAQIERETNWKCYYRPSSAGEGYIGCNVVLVQRLLYTDAIKEEILSKYNDV